jgi:hypothetical protein
MKRILIMNIETGLRDEHLILHGIYPVIHEGDFVKHGHNLAEIIADPHAILNILGTIAI